LPVDAEKAITIDLSSSIDLSRSVDLPSSADTLNKLLEKDEKIADLERQLANNKKLIQYYKSLTTKDNDSACNNAAELDEAIIDAVNEVIMKNRKFSRYGITQLGRLIAKAVFDDRFAMGKGALQFVIHRAKLWLRKHVYTPQAILKEMDLAGGTLNYNGLTVLRRVESKGKRFYRGGIIPSTACLQRAAKVLEKEADKICPFKEINTKWGKGIQFCEARMLKLVCDSFGVTEKAKQEKVSVSESIDASQLTKNLLVITAGFKMIDVDAVDSISGKPLCTDGVFHNVQSRNQVFPLKMILATETKESYDAFKDLFDLFSMASNKSLPRNGEKYAWEAINEFAEFDVTATMDMSATWKGLKKGGACKRERFFCHCYIEALRAKLCDSLETITNATKIKLYPVDHRGKTSEKNSIDYQLSQSNAEDMEDFSEFLSDELELRGLDMTGTLAEMRERLRTSLFHETRIQTLLDQVQHREGIAAALFLVLQAVPCILHCENRVCIKIIPMCLIEGFSNAQAGKIFLDVGKSKKKRCNAYAKQVEKILNTEILGDALDPVQWDCPTVENGLMVGALTIIGQERLYKTWRN
jgi:hypothetical protein